jgi:hypothetical protein
LGSVLVGYKYELANALQFIISKVVNSICERTTMSTSGNDSGMGTSFRGTLNSVSTTKPICMVKPYSRESRFEYDLSTNTCDKCLRFMDNGTRLVQSMIEEALTMPINDDEEREPPSSPELLDVDEVFRRVYALSDSDEATAGGVISTNLATANERYNANYPRSEQENYNPSERRTRRRARRLNLRIRPTPRSMFNPITGFYRVQPSTINNNDN